MQARKLSESFFDACSGIRYVLRTQRNMRIHCLAAVAVLVAATVIGLNPIEMILLAFVITLVLVAEMFNTALEKTVDLITNKYHPLAKVAKHVAAGAVLITAINAVIVGFLIFWGHIIR